MTIITPEFPQQSSLFRSAKLISIADGNGLIYYEAVSDREHPKGVWRFHPANNSWTKIAEMIIARDDFAVLPLAGVSCPGNGDSSTR